MNYTYLVKCADNTLYCGWTNHLEKRMEAHNQERVPNTQRQGDR